MRSKFVFIALMLAMVGCDDVGPRTAPAAEGPAAQGRTDQEEEAPTSPPAVQPPPQPNVAAVSGLPDLADIVAEARPAVVNIYTRTRVVTPTAPSPFFPQHIVPRERIQQSLGSGFIIDDKGLVLTNEHVVRNATQIAVRLLDDRWFEAEIVGTDPKTDVALVRLKDAHNLPSLPLGNSDELRVGNWVIAIGNPLGLNSTVTAGITSAVGRRGLPTGGGELRYQDFIQTDASINPGNSGGPLINLAGEVVGINTAIIADGQGIGFAIPVNMVREILPRLEIDGRVDRSWMGIFVQEVSTRLADELGRDDSRGALVTRLIPGGPAHEAGIQAGDIILEIDGRQVEDANRLTWLASNLGVGNRVDVVLWRGGARQEVRMTLGALPE
ncbi:MAG: S1C family serine protease [Bradymonadaceae bacterium]